MSEVETATADELPLEGVGDKLRRAREGQGLSIAHVAAQTRIPERHLEAIEDGDFSSLPSRTYAVGFSRTYARLVGLDERSVTDGVREELAQAEADYEARQGSFEPGDPTKLPSRGLVWFGGLAAILLVAGVVSFYSSYYGAGTGPAPLQRDPEPALAQDNASDAGGDSAVQMPGASSDGQVVFTALEDGVWVKFYDAAGDRLFEKQMASGERFEIPSDADGPQIWTGRPDAFAITIDGRSVPKLAEDDFVMRDVAISAEALLSRAQAPGAEASAQVN